LLWTLPDSRPRRARCGALCPAGRAGPDTSGRLCRHQRRFAARSPAPAGRWGAPCHGFGSGAGSASASAGCGYRDPTTVTATFDGSAAAAVDRAGLHAYAAAKADTLTSVAYSNSAEARAYYTDRLTIAGPFGAIGTLQINYRYHGDLAASYAGDASARLQNALCSALTPCTSVDPGGFVWGSVTAPFLAASTVGSDLLVTSQAMVFEYGKPFDLVVLLPVIAAVSAGPGDSAYLGTATADFSATATITSIDVLGANGVPLAGGYTIFSENGVDSRSAVPLPAAVWGFGAACAVAWRRRGRGGISCGAAAIRRASSTARS
jgi:hypothetical protein